jgi:hypothetical protein
MDCRNPRRNSGMVAILRLDAQPKRSVNNCLVLLDKRVVDPDRDLEVDRLSNLCKSLRWFDVASFVFIVSNGYTVVLIDSLLYQACTERHFPFVFKSAKLVYICFRRDVNSTVWSIECSSSDVKWCSSDGGRARSTCNSNDSKCQLGRD